MSTSRRIACVRIPSSRTAAPPPAPEARAALAGALLRAAPKVTPARDHPSAFWADASGMELKGGDAAVARALLAAATEAGFGDARVGVAGCCIAAAAATREPTLTGWRVVPPGADARYLRHRSLAVLPLPRDLREALELLGLRRCGELAGLPPAEVELRFGAEGLTAWRLASAVDPRWPFRPATPGVAAAETEFDPPLELAEPLRFVLPGLVESVAAQLAARQRIPARLRLVLFQERAPDGVREVRPARPTADPRVLADLCRRAVDDEPLAAPLAGLRLEALEEAAERADQLDIFQAPAPDPGALHAALLPVFARWGEGALSGAVHHGAHLPSEHAAWEPRGSGGIAAFAASHRPPFGEAATPEGAPRPELPLCLRRLPDPRPVRVREDSGGRPVDVDLQVAHRAGLGGADRSFPPRLWKTKAEGPERISGAWWSRGGAREYWRVESGDGWLGLVYRDAASGEWYLEGWYD